MAQDDTTIAPRVTLTTTQEMPVRPDSVGVRVTFSNPHDAPIHILDQFEPVPVFFSFDIVGQDGTPVFVPAGGKIDFGPVRPGCRALQQHESHSVDIDLRPLLSAPLRAERYSVSVTYHNQYGDRCFQGVVRSNTIAIDIRDRREEVR